MSYCKLFEEENSSVSERYELAVERIREILSEDIVKEPFAEYFHVIADFLLLLHDVYEQTESGALREKSTAVLKKLNGQLFADVDEVNYHQSYANPQYAAFRLGEEYAGMLCFLYTELRSNIACAFEGRKSELAIGFELFVQIYCLFADEELPEAAEVQSVLYWYISDYSEIAMNHRVRELVDPALDFATDIVMNCDLLDEKYLYFYGEPITDTEIEVARFMAELPEEDIKDVAATFTEGFYRGFVNSGKDLMKKSTVNIRYPLGFERIIKEAVKNFRAMGLEPLMHRPAYQSVNKRQNRLIGYAGTEPNRQYGYDHRFDEAIYLDKALVERKLAVYRQALEQYKELAAGVSGPAVLEVFGEKQFTPVNKEEAYKLSEQQRELTAQHRSESQQIIEEYMPSETTSFTIMALPLPDIGPDFQDIFCDTMRINTLDTNVYGEIQQKIIDALDKADYVHITGRNGNKTDLTIALAPLVDPQYETKFENCLADVNIPLGEVFTSPQLEGTNGLLHVKEVYLNGMAFKQLALTFEDGMIKQYDCKNFSDEAQNKDIVKELVMDNHDTLPMGEFAIGTNTPAYVMAKKYDILYQMPILIAEKMGPHFAIGDTCFSHEENAVTKNPDGKRIIAKSNSLADLRDIDPNKAYCNWHLDITIPYEELGDIVAISAAGEKTKIIENGRFVLAGTEKLNEVFL
ncbi:MAG: leucyl aminopeptidase [Lachnospiraceae bacterium]|nr:leucyl aminopeptidase [Lachnospiraceae bacterium]